MIWLAIDRSDLDYGSGGRERPTCQATPDQSGLRVRSSPVEGASLGSKGIHAWRVRRVYPFDISKFIIYCASHKRISRRSRCILPKWTAWCTPDANLRNATSSQHSPNIVMVHCVMSQLQW